MKQLFHEIPVLHGKRVTLRALADADAGALRALTRQDEVYRYLPTFLFEKKYGDPHEVIRRLYDECLENSLILGIFLEERFCGLAEMYSCREPIRKISVGCRLLKECWGQGLATETLGVMVDYLLKRDGVEIITASTMIENQAGARILKKNGFDLVNHIVREDWGYDRPTLADKWLR